MKMIILFILIVGNYSSNSTINDPFSNTIWVAKVGEACVDTLKFYKDNKVFSYSCELDYTFRGYYRVKGSILNVVVTDNSHGRSEKWRYKFHLRNSMLIIVSSEQLLGGQWQIQKTTFDDSYKFVKVK